MRRRCGLCAKALMRSDPVEVQLRRKYSSVSVDVWPFRLSAEGRRRVRAAYCQALSHQRGRRQFSYGRSGGFAGDVDLARADELADELRRICWDADCLEPVELAA